MVIHKIRNAFRKRILMATASLDIANLNKGVTWKSNEEYLDLYRKIIKEEVMKCTDDESVLEKCLEEFIWYDSLKKSFCVNLNNLENIEHAEALELMKNELRERREDDGKGNV